MADNPYSVNVPNPLQALLAGEQSYKEGTQNRAMDDVAAAAKAGDSKALMDALFRAKQIGPAIEMAKLDRQQAASSDFSNALGGIFGGNQSANAPGNPIQPLMQPQPAAPSAAPAPQRPASIAPAPLRPTSNLTDPANTITGVDYGPVRDAVTGAPAAPYRTASLQPPAAPSAPMPQQATAAPQAAPQAAPSTQPQQPASGASIRGVPLQQAIPALLQAATNPSLPKESQELARMLVGKAIDSYPEEIRKLEIFRQRPDLYQLAVGLKQSNNVTIDQRGETEEAKALGKAAGERAGETLKAAGAAPVKLQNLSRMESLLGAVAQGKLEPARMNISAWAKSFGLDDAVAERIGLDPKGVGTAQAVEALSNELTLGHIGPGGLPSNNFSNTDRSFVTEIVPKLGNDPAANQLKIEASRRLTQLDIQKAREWQTFRRDPANKGQGFDDFETQWNDKISKQNIFGDLMQKAQQMPAQQSAPQRSGNIPRFNSPADVGRAGLKSGDHFLDPNGVERVVP